jgi:hypothetical protein
VIPVSCRLSQPVQLAGAAPPRHSHRRLQLCALRGLLWGVTTKLDEASPPWCLRLMSELNAADAHATALATALTPQQLNWKPSPGEWSVGQCLEHLYNTNEVYLPAISDSLVGRPQATVQDITPGWFGQWFIRNYIEPSSKTRRARAPKTIMPGAQVDASILDRFLRSNDEVRQLVVRAGHHNVNRIRFKNPFISLLRFTVGAGLEIVSKHQRRHLLQAERIRTSSAFPPP